MTTTEPLLSVRDLVVTFATEGGLLTALDGVSFDVRAGSALALVGESGCGKTVTGLSILRLLPTPPAKIERGEIRLEGNDLLRLPEPAMRAVRGARVGMVFQEPMTSLNPVYTAGAQIMEAIRLHADVSRGEARARAVDLIRRVGLPRPEDLARSYPHELSGGMRQRVMIAMAIAAGPALLIADEPTTALDMMIEAQILSLLRDLRRELGMALLLIAHDLGMVADVADEVVVLYAGQVVEQGPAAAVTERPAHPYTRALLASVPPPVTGKPRPGRRLPTIEGTVPDLRDAFIGCRFHDRCPDVFERCRVESPELYAVQRHPSEAGTERRVARCFLQAPGAPRPRGADPAVAIAAPHTPDTEVRS